MYDPNSMSKEGRGKLFTWYESKIASNEIFDIQKEMLTYCRSDVDILRRACLTFKDLLKEATQMDGGASVNAYDSCTIAFLCMDVIKNEISERRLVRAYPERREEKMVGGKTT